MKEEKLSEANKIHKQILELRDWLELLNKSVEEEYFKVGSRSNISLDFKGFILPITEEVAKELIEKSKQQVITNLLILEKKLEEL